MDKKWIIKTRYTDQNIICLDKPAWLITHANKHSKNEANLVQLISQEHNQRLYPIHRLDRQTSGLILFSKSSDFVDQMQTLWREQSISKTYLAYVFGHPPEKFSSSKPLKDKKTGESKEAQTDFSVISYYQKGALVEASPKTGRQHQIRRHLSHIGHHIIGDTIYGKGKINNWSRELGLKRLFLHASQMSFKHPISGKHIQISSPLPDELESFLELLRPI